MKITVLGMGAMGSRMAKNWINAGVSVTVWNRSPEAAQQLRAEFEQVTVASTPAEAARDADYVVAMVRDDEASRNVWLGENGALAALSERAIAIESSTLTPDHVQSLAKAFAEAGRTLIEAPVAGTLPQVEAGQLNYMLSGPEDFCEQIQKLLEPQAKTFAYTGDYGQAAKLKLAVNSMLAVQVAALSEILSTLEKQGIEREAAMDVLNTMSTSSPAAEVMGKLMSLRKYNPLFPIQLVAKDMAYASHVFNAESRPDSVISTSRNLYQTAVAQGLGRDNIAGLIQHYE